MAGRYNKNIFKGQKLEHLLEGIPGLENIPLLRGYIFGVVHAGLKIRSPMCLGID